MRNQLTVCVVKQGLNLMNYLGQLLLWISTLKNAIQCIVKAQINYCPLVWMLHSRKLNNKTNRLRKKYLRSIYNNNLSTFDKLLGLDNSVSIHHRNSQCLAIESYKMFNGISRDIIKDVFPLNASFMYDIKNRQIFYTTDLQNPYIKARSHHHSWTLKYGKSFLKVSNHMACFPPSN